MFRLRIETSDSRKEYSEQLIFRDFSENTILNAHLPGDKLNDSDYDLIKNIQEAQKMSAKGSIRGLYEFFNKVKSGSQWDYKRNGQHQFEALGNKNYGATVLPVVNENEELAKWAAGIYQVHSGTSAINKKSYIKVIEKVAQLFPTHQVILLREFLYFIESLLCDTYGDDPLDVEQIKEGFEKYKQYIKEIKDFNNTINGRLIEPIFDKIDTRIAQYA